MPRNEYPYHCRIQPNGTYHIKVDYRYRCTAKTLKDAVQAADDVVIALEKRSDEDIGRWKLNHPERYDPPTLRRIKNAKERGDWHELYGQYLNEEPSAEIVIPPPTPAFVQGFKNVSKYEKYWSGISNKGTDPLALRAFPNGLDDILHIAHSVEYDHDEVQDIVIERLKAASE